jgi:tripartite ATP-independent transporter DctM subunit
VFAFLPIPLFVLMGEIIFQSESGAKLVGTIDKLLGNLPGKLCLVSTAAGVLVGSMIGISGATIAIIGRTLLPEMSKRGYKPKLTLGSIVITGTIDNLIPPSALAIILGIIAKISIGQLLIAIIVPGVILAVLVAAYIIIRVKVEPDLAPPYKDIPTPLREKFSAFATNILPTGLVIFAVIGSVFMGIATPSEAAALGVIACFILAAIHKKFSFRLVRNSANNAVEIMTMVLFIVLSAITFGRLLSTSGALADFTQFAVSLHLPNSVLVIFMLIIVLIMGCFMDGSSILMITAPIFIPLVQAMDFNVLWFGVEYLIAIQLGLITPPFGMDVFTMHAIAPEYSLSEIFRSSMPLLAISLLLMVLIWVFPALATWLPGLMSM